MVLKYKEKVQLIFGHSSTLKTPYVWSSTAHIPKTNTVTPNFHCFYLLVAQLVEHQAVTREFADSNPGRINTQDLKITEEKVLPL